MDFRNSSSGIMNWASYEFPEMESFDSYMRSRAREFFGPDWDDYILRTMSISSSSQPTSLPNQPLGQQPLTSSKRNREPAIRVDVSESGEMFIVRADLPGCKKEDVRLNIDDSQKILIIDANVRNPELKRADLQCALNSSSAAVSSSMQSQISSSASSSSLNEPSAMPGTQHFSRSHPNEHQQQQSSFPANMKQPQDNCQQPQQLPQNQSLYSQPSSQLQEISTTWMSQEFAHLNERRSGSLHRTICLPKRCNTANICSQLQDGVLTICFKKSPESETKRNIAIH